MVWTRERKFVDDVSVDSYKDKQHKPKLRVAGPASMSGLDFWLLFFRSKSIGEILQEANARLKSHQKRITKGGLYKAIGLLYALTLDVRRQRWDYCATASADDLCPTPAFSVRFGMVRDHFQQILAALSFGPAEDGRGPWLSENALINMHLCICPTSAMERRHCLNSFTNIQSLIVSCYQGQRWVAKQAKSAYFKHFQDLGTGYNFLPKCPSGSASGRTRA